MVREDRVLRGVMRAATAEHEVVHAHADVSPVGLYAFVHEHAGSLDAVHGARLRLDLSWKRRRN